MKTSLLAPAPASQSVKADRPQQLKSVTVYFRGRKMVLMQRPQRRLSLLLCRMLRRSMLNLLGRLPAKLAAPVRKVLSAGALCAMALASATTAHATATVDTLPVNTLPTNPAVVYGSVGIGTTGNQMNVDIGTNKAVINWGSFSIGSQAGVDFHFDNATSTSSVLNRVIGNDPSKIMGSLTSNGKVFLINSAGILVGKTAKIDVAGFVASTLNITNSDFLAGKMSFHDQHRHHRPAGDVVIEEDGAIKTKEGGSVYLIGANVENGGVITSPKGEVLLAAGHSVDLVDTGTPGVKINVKGDKGKVTNLGKIIAQTGTIGFGAALINNSGVINASSVDNVGGRIFLRASKDLTTTETSSINADGTIGGNVVLYADGTSIIDGDVSALGNVDGQGGAGGYVDTSGKTALAVHYAPRVGKGGEWFIDPANVDIVTTFSQNGLLQQILQWLGIVSLNGTHSEIEASSINATLNGGTNVTIATGIGSNTGGDAGDITIANGVNIAKSSANGPATLTLNAANNISIGENVQITDDGTAAHGLGLVLNAGYSDSVAHTNTGAITTSNNATISVANGFEAHATTYKMTGGNLTSSSGVFVMDAAFTGNSSAHVSAGGTVTMGAVTLNSSSLKLTGGTAKIGATTIDSNSSLSVQGGANVTANGTITGMGLLALGADNTETTTVLDAGANTVSVGSLNEKAGTLKGTGSLTVLGSFAQSGGSINFHDVSLTQANGVLTVGNVTATTSLHLTASNNAIAQVASTHLTASTLEATAATGIALNNTGNAIGTFTATNYTSGDIAFKNGTAIGTGPITNTAGAVSIESESGNIQLGNVSAASMAVTADSGNISQTGTLTVAGTLNASATTGITLGNTSNEILALTASNSGTGDITVTTHGGNHLTLNDVSATNGNITITNTLNDIQLHGNLSTGTVGSTGTAVKTVTLTSGAGIVQQSESSSTVTTDQLSATAHLDIDIGLSGNHIGKFTASSDTGHISLANADALTTGTISAASDKYVTLTCGGKLTVGDTLTGSNVTLTSTNGDIAVNGNVQASQTGGTVTLTANSGALTQTAGITADSLVANADTGITLNNTSNSIRSNFSANNSASGNISLVNHYGEAVDALTLGAINNGVRNVTINTNHNLLQSSDGITAGTLDVTASGGINLNSQGNHIGTFKAVNPLGNINVINNGDLILGVISGPSGTVNVTANGGEVTQIGAMTAGSANVTATGGITLNNAGNNIGAFTASNSGKGDIALTDTASTLNLNGTISNNASGGNITITNTGNITSVSNIVQEGQSPPVIVNGTFADNDVTLISTGGDVTLAKVVAKDLTVSAVHGAIKSNAGQISLQISDTMTATANKGISLLGNSNATVINHIANFDGTNAGSGVTGDITVYNQSTGESVNNLVQITNNSGDIFVDNTGAMKTTGLISAPNGAVHLATHSPLTIGAGGINAHSGVSLTAGDGLNASDTIVVNGVITNVIGSPSITGNHVTMNAHVVGPAPVFPGPNPPDLGSGYASIPIVDTSNSAPAPVVVPPNNAVDQNVHATTDDSNNGSSGLLPTVNTSTTGGVGSNNANQTAGGGDGEFGGSKDDGKTDKNGKSSKTLPMCT